MKKTLTLLPVMLLVFHWASFAQTTTYNYTGASQTYTVPQGVTSINVDAWGARGGHAGPASALGTPTTPGCGGRVQATLTVTPGQILNLNVGGKGVDGDGITAPSGGYNGGGNAAIWPVILSPVSGGSGGGKTDISTGATTLIVAGGGGGAGYNGSPCTPTGDQPGGDGGGLTGATVTTCTAYIIVTLGYTGVTLSGGGGSASGGVGGALLPTTNYAPGTAGIAGIGGDNVAFAPGSLQGGGIGGGGGGGWYGGGGGCWMGGGGGSSYTNPAFTAGVFHTQGYNCAGAPAGDGQVTICAPTPGTITGSLFVCPGATTSLSDPVAPAGGNWSSTALGIATIEPSTGIVHGVAAGTTQITYSFVSPGCGSGYATATVTVNPGPSVIGGPHTVCMGSTITLTDAIGGGTWTSSPTSVAGIGSSSGVVTPASVGTAFITYDNGCGAPVSTTITVNPLPAAITGTLSVCQGASTTLSDVTPGGTWSSVTPATATVISSTGVVTGAAGGAATISYTIATGCAATTTVNVIPPLAPITGPHKVCTGQTISLGALPAGGAWSSSNSALATVGTGGVVSGVSMGLVQITYTIGAGCSAIQFVTVNPVAPILGTDSVCQGLTSYLTNIVGGGIWSSATTAVATITFDSGKVSGLTPGTTVVTYLLPTGCSSSATVSVISFPPAITGTMRACPGTTTALSDGTPNGRWSSSDTGVATVSSSGVVTGRFANTVDIKYTILPGCSVTTNVTINPLPAVITGRTTFCPGISDSLHDADPDGLWSSGTPSLATVVDTSGIVTALSGGSAVISYTLPTGCARTKTLSVNPAPHPVVTYNFLTYTFVTPDIWVSYQWYDSIIGKMPGATSPSVGAANNDYYYVVVTDSNGCKGASDTMYFQLSEAGIRNQVAGNHVRIFPNPTTGMLYIESSVRVRAVITGIDGKKEMEQADAKEMDISRLAPGMYFVALYDDNQQIISVQKLVRQ